MSVKLTTSYWKIREMRKKIRVIQGSMSSAKTFSILIQLFEMAVKQPRTVSTVVTETYPQLKDGVISDMRSIMREAGMDFESLYNKSDKDLILPNKAVIQFRNVDNKDFHKSKGARRHRLFLNEINRLAYPSVEQMIVRTDGEVFMDYNPDREFWVHDEILNAGRDDYDFIILTYKDNEMIPAGELAEIERRIHASKQPGASDQLKNWVKIYAYGELGTYSERRIYSYDFIDEIPATAKRINSGMDFGQSPDPTVLIDLYVDGINLIADERFSANNLMAERIRGADRESIVDRLEALGFPKGQTIVGDSAGRIEILDMRKHGYNARAVKKYPGSVGDGIRKLRGYNLLITRRSSTLKKGIESWFWKVDPNGKIVPEPDGHEPDGLAAIRYAILTYHNKAK